VYAFSGTLIDADDDGESDGTDCGPSDPDAFMAPPRFATVRTTTATGSWTRLRAMQ